ncbi:hypothetical protein ACFX1X_020285 [Malus domestica]
MKLASGFRGKDLLAFCWICRWEKYQSEEEVALGRGKRLRKAVSYREAYAAHPTETLSENLDINQGLISIPEGHVGVYWRGSALLKTITYPGFHLNLPLVTHFELVQVTLQTYQITLVIHVWKIEDSVLPFIIVLKASVSNIVGKGYSMWYKRGCHDQF